MGKMWNKGLLAVMVIVAMAVIAGCGGGSQDKTAEKPAGEAAEQPAAPTLTEKAGEKLSGVKVGGAERNDMRAKQKGQNIKKGGTLVFGGAKMLSNLNPFIGTTSVNQRIRELSYENLLSLDETAGNIYPGLAKEWKISPDAKEYTFFLRQGVKFHNGKELTADDVVWTINYVNDPRNAARGESTLNMVDKVEAIDKYTVKITLKEPSTAFLANLADIRSMVIIPAGSMEVGVERKLDAPPPGTGPFKWVSWVPEQEVVLEAFDDYWQGRPHIDRFVYKSIENDDVRFNALRAGDVDMAERIPLPQVQRIDKGEIQGLAVYPAAIADYRRIAFNTQRPPFDNVKMRQAVAYAFDAQNFVDEVFWGYGTIMNIKMPPGSKWTQIDFPKRGPDLAKAKQLLQEAGYDGRPIVMLGRKGHEAIAENIQRQLSPLGLNIKIEITESGVYDERQTDGDFDMTIRGGQILADPSPSLRPEYYTQKGELRSSNVAGWSDPKTDALFDKMDTTVDPEERFEVYKELALYLYEQVPYLDLGCAPRFFAARDYVKDFVPSANESYVHANGGIPVVWLDK